ncbi:hypothetical protein [Shewanella woodyi]|uniref:hypothetical protein n=1 Tax=Shewanella woodyi TaxID=60961 RepID=UPI0007F97BE6|nr:hypothetical protein [Shewanella woodyi]
MKILISLLLVISLSACSSYEFSDMSRVYCSTSNPELREQVKAAMEDKGVGIGIDYCASVGLVDALLVHQPD